MINNLGEKGATSILPLMFSSMGGMIFLLSFYNLTQFTASRSAADQAARRAARCIATTDPDINCSASVQISNPETNDIEWYGYEALDGPSEVQVDLFNYRGNVIRDSYGAEYNSYEVATSNPVVEWTEKRVKPQRFVGLLNSYANLESDLTVRYWKNINGSRVTRDCTLRNEIQVPFGMNFENSTNYLNEQWCENIKSNYAYINANSNCNDIDPTWVQTPDPMNNFWTQDGQQKYPCEMVLPQRGMNDPTEQPWLLMGGAPVCEGENGAPDRVNMTQEELKTFYGDEGVPGDTNKPYPITNGRQFVVVTVYSCNPEGILARLRGGLQAGQQDSNFLKNNFTNLNSINADGFSGHPWGDFDANTSLGPDQQNSFVYNQAEGMSYVAPQNWTYFEWHRETNDGVIRSLRRKVCDWSTIKEAQTKWEEFLPFGDLGNPLSYSPSPSGVDLLDVPELTFVDVPSCLPSEDVPREETRYVCGNRYIDGQIQEFSSCTGWEEEKAQRESEFMKNMDEVRKVNIDSSWKELVNVPDVSGFETEIVPAYSNEGSDQRWEFSFSNNRFNDMAIFNPSAIRDKNGYNPKRLTQDNQVVRYRRIDSDVANSPESLAREREIFQAILRQEGVSGQFAETSDSGISYNTIHEDEEDVIIKNVYPFIMNGDVPVPQARPYVNPEVSGGFDFNLDCDPSSVCSESTSHESMESLLRSNANSVVSEIDLTDRSYVFNFSEDFARREIYKTDQLPTYPACTQYRTVCDGRKKDDAPKFLGKYNQIPPQCLNGDYLDCYPDYQSEPVTSPEYGREIDVEKAKGLALAEMRRLMPGANLCENGDMSQNCVNVEINEAGEEVQVSVSFIAPLTMPFTQFFKSNSLTISSVKRELIESERLN